MLRSKAYVKVSNRGKVVKVVKEHYLRDDIPCGVDGCQLCRIPEPASEHDRPPVLLSPIPDRNSHQKFSYAHLIIPDTNILLHHLDIFETASFHDVVICQTVLDEVRNQSNTAYNRIRGLIGNPDKHFFVFSNEHHRDIYIEKMAGESDNDRNDRAIRTTVTWYKKHLLASRNSVLQNLRIILVTNDEDNRKKALEEGIEACRLSTYVESIIDNSTLFDIIDTVKEVSKEDEFSGYEEYLPETVLLSGINSGRFVRGTIHQSLYNCFEGSVSTDQPSPLSSILVKGRINMNRAFNGDIVVVEVFPAAEWLSDSQNTAVEEDISEETGSLPVIEATPITMTNRATGKIVGILKRNWRTYCGSLDRRSINASGTTQSVLFIPMDRRLPRIRIRTRQAQLLSDQRIIVAIDCWDRTSKYPAGHFVRTIGMAGDRNTETEAILLEHDVAYTDFSPQVLSCLPSEDWKPTVTDYAERADFRNLDICSIDPPGCTDIDDALHARTLQNGNIEVGVHIADVTYFVKAGGAMDAEATSRGTTVYLVDKRIDMLPPLLGTNICSLKSNVERLAFSVIWEMSPAAEILGVRFTKSIIRSQASFTYDQAQDRLDTAPTDDLSKSLHCLNSLAKQLRQRRIDAGALTLASPEVRFSLDDATMNPIDVEIKEMKAANALVEEFMLLANIYVAKQIYRAFPEAALLRRHPSPPAENFEGLNRALEARGFHLEINSSKALADSLDRIIVTEDPFFNKLVRIMTTRCMLQANYFSSGTTSYDMFWHYGLATPIYTHFTSPIRRYSDVVVHRLLAASLDPKASSMGSLDKQGLGDVCNNLNYRHTMAQHASRSSVELYSHMYFKGKTIRETAYVVRLMPNGFVALIPKYGIDGVVAFDEITMGNTLAHDLEQNKFVLRENGQTFICLFQQIEVEVTVEQIAVSQRQKLCIKMISPQLPSKK